MTPSRGALAQKTSADCVQIIENTRPKPKMSVAIAPLKILKSLWQMPPSTTLIPRCAPHAFERERECLRPFASRKESDPETDA